MFADYVSMLFFMVLVMVGVMLLTKATEYVFWYLFLRNEEQFRRLICRFDEDFAVRMKAFNITRKDVLARAKSLPHTKEENEDKSMLEVLRQVARELCEEKLNEMEDKRQAKFLANQ
jgi:hypothetical protein